VPAARAAVSIYDRGFLYGDAFFETIRFYGGRPLFWDEHLRRLAASLGRFAIPWPEHDLRRAASDLLAACALREAALRLTITRGVGEGLVPPPGIAPTCVLVARAIPSDLAAERERGWSVVRLAFGHGRGGTTSSHKNVDYLAAVAGRMRAARSHASEALFVEADGTVSEGTTSNVFTVRRGVVQTPPVAAGALPGITRAAVVRAARRAGIEIRESPLRARDLDAADEIFLTGSVIEVMPVVRLDRRRVGAGTPGDVTRAVQSLYARVVARGLERADASAPRAGKRSPRPRVCSAADPLATPDRP